MYRIKTNFLIIYAYIFLTGQYTFCYISGLFIPDNLKLQMASLFKALTNVLLIRTSICELILAYSE